MIGSIELINRIGAQPNGQPGEEKKKFEPAQRERWFYWLRCTLPVQQTDDDDDKLHYISSSGSVVEGRVEEEEEEAVQGRVGARIPPDPIVVISAHSHTPTQTHTHTHRHTR